MQTLWQKYAKEHPAAQRKAKFELDDDMDRAISAMCKGERYRRYSPAMQEGCRQLTTNVKMKVVKPFLQVHTLRHLFLGERMGLMGVFAGRRGPQAAHDAQVARLSPMVPALSHTCSFEYSGTLHAALRGGGSEGRRVEAWPSSHQAPLWRCFFNKTTNIKYYGYSK